MLNFEAWLYPLVGEWKKVNGDVCVFFGASQHWPWFENSNETRSAAASRTIKTTKEGEKNCEDKNNEIRRSIKVYDDASKSLITENEKNIERRIF